MNVYGSRNWSTIAIDATGLIPSNQGQYRRKGRKRGFIKIHVAVRLIEKAKEHADVKVVIGDGEYDSFDVYEATRKDGIYPKTVRKVGMSIGIG